jgi:hypothetical protein
MTTPAPVIGEPELDAMLPAAVNLIWAVRTEDADEVATARTDAHNARLNTKPTDRSEVATLRALIVLLAGLVPDDRSPQQLLRWLRNPQAYRQLRNDGYDADTAGSIAAARTGEAA